MRDPEPISGEAVRTPESVAVVHVLVRSADAAAISGAIDRLTACAQDPSLFDVAPPDGPVTDDWAREALGPREASGEVHVRCSFVSSGALAPSSLESTETIVDAEIDADAPPTADLLDPEGAAFDQ